MCKHLNLIPNPSDVHLRDGLKAGQSQKKTNPDPTQTLSGSIIKRVNDDDAVWSHESRAELKSDIYAVWRVDKEILLGNSGKFTVPVIGKIAAILSIKLRGKKTEKIEHS